MTCPYPTSLSRIRKREYPLLDGTTYLDHAGTTPYPRSSIRAFSRDLKGNLFGNPHSKSPSSICTTNRVNATRKRLLQFFSADPEDFDLVFVANATAAIKLVIECINDYSQSQHSPGLWYGYHADSHSSLVGPREVASESCYFASDHAVEAWMSGEHTSAKSDVERLGLFAFPGQSNFNGRRLPLSWCGRLRHSQIPSHRNTFSLLDAAALASTAQLDLSNEGTAPDFTAVSLYKIFGFPNLGALIVRKASSHALRKRRYFGGGTVDMVINSNGSHETWSAKKGPLDERLEDGTLPFHNIIALDSALTTHEHLYDSMHNVSDYTCALSKALVDSMKKLRHGNNMPVCRIYSEDLLAYGDKRRQGPTVAFNIMNSQGAWIGKSDVEQLAIANNIQLRTGGVCNPGGIAAFLQLTPTEMRENFEEGLRCGNEIDVLNGKPTGVVRVSLGAMTSGEDIRMFLEFLKLFVDESKTTVHIRNPSTSFESDQAWIIKKLKTSVSDLVQVEEKDAEELGSCPVARCRVILPSRDLKMHLMSHAMSKPSGCGMIRTRWRWACWT